jgi:hypothetical protein
VNNTDYLVGQAERCFRLADSCMDAEDRESLRALGLQYIAALYDLDPALAVQVTASRIDAVIPADLAAEAVRAR